MKRLARHLVRNPQALIAMNLPSLDKYEHSVRPGGVMVINSSIISRPVERNDVRAVYFPGNEIAEELGDRRMTNMVLLGGLLANLPVLTLESSGACAAVSSAGSPPAPACP